MDNEMNAYEATVLIDGTWQQTAWERLVVGNIVKVYKDKQIPADLMLISTSMGDGICYIETSNLDGYVSTIQASTDSLSETNLKIKQASVDLIDLRDNDNALSAKLGCIECDPPNAEIDKFNGKMTDTSGRALPLGLNEILLRVCDI